MLRRRALLAGPYFRSVDPTRQSSWYSYDYFTDSKSRTPAYQPPLNEDKMKERNFLFGVGAHQMQRDPRMKPDQQQQQQSETDGANKRSASPTRHVEGDFGKVREKIPGQEDDSRLPSSSPRRRKRGLPMAPFSDDGLPIAFTRESVDARGRKVIRTANEKIQVGLPVIPRYGGGGGQQHELNQREEEFHEDADNDDENNKFMSESLIRRQEQVERATLDQESFQQRVVAGSRDLKPLGLPKLSGDDFEIVSHGRGEDDAVNYESDAQPPHLPLQEDEHEHEKPSRSFSRRRSPPGDERQISDQYQQHQQEQQSHQMRITNRAENEQQQQQQQQQLQQQQHHRRRRRQQDDDYAQRELSPRKQLLREFTISSSPDACNRSCATDLIVELAREIANDVSESAAAAAVGAASRQHSDVPESKVDEKQQQEQQPSTSADGDAGSNKSGAAPPLLAAICRTSHIVAQRRHWLGALGLLTAVRVAPFVVAGSEQQQHRQCHEQLSSAALTDFQRAHTAAAMALSQSVSRTLRGRQSAAEVLHLVTSVARHIASTDLQPQPQQQQPSSSTKAGSDNDTSNNDSNLVAIQAHSGLVSNFILSSCIQAVERRPAARARLVTQPGNEGGETQRIDDDDDDDDDAKLQTVAEQQTHEEEEEADAPWKLGLQLLQTMDISPPAVVAPSSSASTSSSSSASSNYVAPAVFGDAVPFAFASCARMLRRSGKVDAAIQLLEQLFFDDDRTHDAVRRCPTPQQALCRLYAIKSSHYALQQQQQHEDNSSLYPSPSAWSRALSLAVELTKRDGESTTTRRGNVSDYFAALSATRQVLLGSPAAIAFFLEDSFTNVKNDGTSSQTQQRLLHFVVDALAKCPFNKSTEAIDSAAAIISQCGALSPTSFDEALARARATVAAEEAKAAQRGIEEAEDEGESSHQQHHRPRRRPFLTAYQQVLKDSGNLLHPCIIAAFMRSAVRAGHYTAAIRLFDNNNNNNSNNNNNNNDNNDSGDADSAASMPPPPPLALICSASVVSTIPFRMKDRRVDFAAVNALAASIAHRMTATASNASDASSDGAVAAFDSNTVLAARFDVIRQVVLSSVAKLMLDADDGALKRDRHRGSRRGSREQQQQGDGVEKTEDSFAAHQALAIYAPTLHERGVNECVAAYLSALDLAAMTTATSSSSSTSKSTSLIAHDVERASKELTSSSSKKQQQSHHQQQHSSSSQQDSVVVDALSLLPPHSWRPAHLPALLRLLRHRGAHHKVSLVFQSLQRGCNKLCDEIFSQIPLLRNEGRLLRELGVSSDELLRLRQGEEGSEEDDDASVAAGGADAGGIDDPANMSFHAWKAMSLETAGAGAAAGAGAGAGGYKERNRKKQSRREREKEADEQFKNRMAQRWQDSRIRNRLAATVVSSSAKAAGIAGRRGGSGAASTSARIMLPLSMDAECLAICVRSMCDSGHWSLALATAEQMGSTAALADVVASSPSLPSHYSPAALDDHTDDINTTNNNNNNTKDQERVAAVEALRAVLSDVQDKHNRRSASASPSKRMMRIK